VRAEREAAAVKLKGATDKVAALEKELAKQALKVRPVPCNSSLFAGWELGWRSTVICLLRIGR
jgi:hypothetical protein